MQREPVIRRSDGHAERHYGAVLRILADPAFKQQLEHRAYQYGREMGWPTVGRQMLDLFRAAAVCPGAIADARPLALAALDRPPLGGIETGTRARSRRDASPGVSLSRGAIS